MGKGTRNRACEKRLEKRQEEYRRLQTEARRLHSRTNVWCILAFAVSALTVVYHLFCFYGIANPMNPNPAIPTDRILLVGAIGLGVFTVGVILWAILLLCAKPKLSLIGTALSLIGAAVFVVFLSMLLTYYPATSDGVRDYGKTLESVVFSNGSALLPLVALTVAQFTETAAAKKRELSSMVKNGAPSEDDVSTLTLADE